MTDNLVELDSQRPHNVVDALCRHCGKEWKAVVPVAVWGSYLECPKCHAADGCELI